VGQALAGVPAELADRIVFLGRVSEHDKARMLRSVDVHVAPNTGGESFGMILTEAMAASAPVVATDMDAFRRVLDGAGRLFPAGDAPALAAVIGSLLDDPAAREAMAARGREVVAGYDWPVVAGRVLEVYASAIEATGGQVVDEPLDEAPPVH
jgi:phosphatidylinositol alpha-mannosyltransferase